MKQKVRGHKRRWKHIEQWVENNKNLDLNYIRSNQRDYVKFRVRPWSALNLGNSSTTEPTGETRIRIIEGLLTIYNSWKLQLDSLDEPYYLKIWLYEPHLSQSQIVCALGDYQQFYENTFYKTEQPPQTFKPQSYGKVSSKLSTLSWESHLDENHIEASWYENPDEYATYQDYLDDNKWFINQLKKPHRITEHDGEKLYSFTKGLVWIGG